MVVHIVLFNFRPENRKENIKTAKEMLNGLVESIPTLNSMEVGINYSDKERAMDMSIITTFDTKWGLEAYATHPEHLKVVAFLKEVLIESRVVDYVKD